MILWFCLFVTFPSQWRYVPSSVTDTTLLNDDYKNVYFVWEKAIT